jgi:hypothetical protein
VNRIAEAQTQLSSLTLVSAQQAGIIDELKNKIKKVCFERKDVHRDEDMCEYLSSIIKNKDKILDEKVMEI